MFRQLRSRKSDYAFGDPFGPYQHPDPHCTQSSLMLVNCNKSLDRRLNGLTLRSTPPHPVSAANKSNSPQPRHLRPSQYSQLHNICNKGQQLEFIILNSTNRYRVY